MSTTLMMTRSTAAEEARDRAKHDAEHERDERDAEADEERNLNAGQRAAEHVAPHPVGAERMRERWRLHHGAQIRLQRPLQAAGSGANAVSSRIGTRIMSASRAFLLACRKTQERPGAHAKRKLEPGP
jgi:hypothetical protein